MMWTTIIVDWADVADTTFYRIAAVTICIMWLKVFFFLRIFKIFAGIFMIVSAIVVDMIVFLFLFFIIISGFNNSFFVLSLNDPTKTFED